MREKGKFFVKYMEIFPQPALTNHMVNDDILKDMTKKIVIFVITGLTLLSIPGILLVEEESQKDVQVSPIVKLKNQNPPVVRNKELRLDSSEESMIEFLANFYLSNKKYDQALVFCQQLVQNSPINSKLIRLKFTIANIYNLQKKYDQSVQTYDEIIRDLKTSYPTSITEYNRYEDQMKPYQEEFRAYTNAVRRFNREGGQKPVRPVKPQVARPQIPSPQELEMNIARAIMAITNIYQSNQKIDLAEKTLKDLAHEGLTKEFSWIALYSLASLYESQQRYDDALNSYEELLKLEFKKGSIYYPQLAGTPVDPEISYDYFLLSNITPSRPATILVYIANLYEKQGKYDQALKTYQRIIENKESLDIDITTANFFMGNLYELLGELSDAKECYKRILEEDLSTPKIPGDIPVVSRLGWLVSIAQQRMNLFKNVSGEKEKLHGAQE